MEMIVKGLHCKWYSADQRATVHEGRGFWPNSFGPSDFRRLDVEHQKISSNCVKSNWVETSMKARNLPRTTEKHILFDLAVPFKKMICVTGIVSGPMPEISFPKFERG